MLFPYSWNNSAYGNEMEPESEGYKTTESSAWATGVHEAT